MGDGNEKKKDAEMRNVEKQNGHETKDDATQRGTYSSAAQHDPQ